MDVSSYLAKLVQNRKEVGISGLGTFYKKKSPGRYNIETHSFIPPTFILQFKTEVTAQNELADYISREKNISVDSANYFIGQFVEELQKQLEVHKEAELPSIGKLSLADGALIFKSEMTSDSGFEFYGLPQIKDEELIAEEQTPAILEEPVEAPGDKEPAEERPVHEEEPIGEEKPSKEEESVTEEEPVKEENPVHEERSAGEEDSIDEESVGEGELPTVEDPIFIEQEEQAVEEEPMEEPMEDASEVTDEPEPISSAEEAILQEPLPEEEQKKKTPVYLKVILGILILLIAFFIVYLLYPDVLTNLNEKFNQNGQKALVAPVNPVSAIKPADTLAKSEGTSQDSISKSETKPAVDTTITYPADTATTYEVIGSSPYNLKEADQFIANMKARHGITAKIVSQKKGKKIKISIATFTTKKEADLKRQELSKKLGIKGLYTYQNIHKPE